MVAATTTSSGSGGSLTVTQTRSAIGTKPKHRGTLRALGLHGIGTSNTLPDRPEVRGMIARVPHLVNVAEAAAAKPAKATKAAKATKETKAAKATNAAKATEPSEEAQ
jgi:large subunit ribosomal protein L30